MRSKDKTDIAGLYKGLLVRHGRPEGQWRLWCKRPKTAAEKEEVMIGAILTQNTNWRNVEKAVGNLKSRDMCSLAAIYRLEKKKIKALSALIKPAGFYNQKARYLLNLAEFVVGKRGGIGKLAGADREELRSELLDVKGVGRETADSILLYALEKPVFVIDEYTRRFLNVSGINPHTFPRHLPIKKGVGIKTAKDYESLRSLFENGLKPDFRLYQDFHALIVIDGKS